MLNNKQPYLFYLYYVLFCKGVTKQKNVGDWALKSIGEKRGRQPSTTTQKPNRSEASLVHRFRYKFHFLLTLPLSNDEKTKSEIVTELSSEPFALLMCRTDSRQGPLKVNAYQQARAEVFLERFFGYSLPQTATVEDLHLKNAPFNVDSKLIANSFDLLFQVCTNINV